MLTDEQAAWLKVLIDTPTPLTRRAVADEVIAELLPRGLIRLIGSFVVVTYDGIQALAAHRKQGSSPSKVSTPAKVAPCAASRCRAKRQRRARAAR